MVVPLRIVKLIRNYCKIFSVLIPYRCHSAGTLISLGADEIIMTKLAELTPVDPTSENHPFNPRAQNPLNPAQQISLPVSVEDVRSYLSFAKDVYNADRGDMIELYSKMTNQPYPNITHLHPLALGNVYRVQKMIKTITEKLLKFHYARSGKTNKENIQKIIKEITEDISIHNYPIYRDEAKDLNLNIVFPDKEEEVLIWELFRDFSVEMKLDTQFNALEEVGDNQMINGICHGAFIESVEAKDVFDYMYQLFRVVQPGMVTPMGMAPVNYNLLKAQWELIK